VEHKDLKVFLSCECSDPEHIVIVSVWDWDDSHPDFNISVQARNWKPFYKRVWAALKYIFGADLVWDDVLVDRKDIPKLQAAIDHYNNLLDKEKKLD
jgi:hypothetical protein